MDKISTSVASLLDSFNPVLQKLADTFCVSIDFLRENAMYYIMEYGKYYLVTTIVNTIWIVLFVEISLGIGLYFIIRSALWSHYYYGINLNRSEATIELYKKLKDIKLIPIIIGTLIFILILWVLSMCVSYWISPEVYSIKAVMELVQNVQ